MTEITAEADAPTNDDIIEYAGDLLGTIATVHGAPVDFDGCAISILREPGTGRLLAAILSPVDMHGDEPFPRWQVNPTAVAKVKEPKMVLLN